MELRGSGTWSPSTSLNGSRSSISTMRPSDCTRWGRRPMARIRRKRAASPRPTNNGSWRDARTRCCDRYGPCVRRGPKPAKWCAKRSTTSSTTGPACATTNSEPAVTTLGRGWWKPPASTSSAVAANAAECVGPSPVPRASSVSAASCSTTAGRTTGNPAAVRTRSSTCDVTRTSCCSPRRSLLETARSCSKAVRVSLWRVQRPLPAPLPEPTRQAGWATRFEIPSTQHQPSPKLHERGRTVR